MPYKDPEIRRLKHNERRTTKREKVLAYEAKYRAEHPEQIAESRARFKESHPDYDRKRAGTPKRKATKRSSYHRNKDKISAKQKEKYRKKHPIIQRDWSKLPEQRLIESREKARIGHWKKKFGEDWQEAMLLWQNTPNKTPEHHRAVRVIVNNRRRVRLAGASGSHTIDQWLAKVKLYGSRCYYCMKKVKMTEDHIIPLAKGGTDDIDNIIPACARCNSKKYNKPVEVFLTMITGQIQIAF